MGLSTFPITNLGVKKIEAMTTLCSCTFCIELPYKIYLTLVVSVGLAGLFCISSQLEYHDHFHLRLDLGTVVSSRFWEISNHLLKWSRRDSISPFDAVAPTMNQKSERLTENETPSPENQSNHPSMLFDVGYSVNPPMLLRHVSRKPQEFLGIEDLERIGLGKAWQSVT